MYFETGVVSTVLEWSDRSAGRGGTAAACDDCCAGEEYREGWRPSLQTIDESDESDEDEEYGGAAPPLVIARRRVRASVPRIAIRRRSC